ncbi:HAD-IA family hydrolase [Breznakiella homolactica]|uniref:HAD-IA family hydrolase n=1 Tax=Breznakiella homolactica TaxID=2798577 RepID=A0A7T8BAV1_9SPIR|nr:HAD-IA family hydrolase [Breznakiella homolactica]QQO08538.1 HAD-IA family hydrolase [Breznakiella homolactica]
MIRHILFDLDNTLYSKIHNIEPDVDRRVTQFVADYLSISLEEAQEQRKRNIPTRYVTSTQWLMEEEGLKDINYYYSMVYPEDEAENLPPSPELRSFIESLPLPYAILTNSPMVHALTILRRLGVSDLFPFIIDIRENALLGKPHEGAYRNALAVLGAEPETTLFIDDSISCVEGFQKIGGQGILFDEFNEYPDWPHEKIRKLEEIRRFL